MIEITETSTDSAGQTSQDAEEAYFHETFGIRAEDYNTVPPSPPPCPHFEQELELDEHMGWSAKPPQKQWGDRVRGTDEKGQHARAIAKNRKKREGSC